MATTKLLFKYGTQLCFADHEGDFTTGTPHTTGTAANSLIIGTPTEIQLDLTGVAATEARESDKTATLADTGTSWPGEWELGACLEHVDTPTAGEYVNFYWCGSPNATAASGNAGLVTGSDADIAIAGKSQWKFIGQLILRAAAVNINPCISRFRMPYLYGSLIVENVCPTKAMFTDAVEMHVVCTPIIPDGQAAA